jgi:hypothetical protein
MSDEICILKLSARVLKLSLPNQEQKACGDFLITLDGQILIQ